MGTGDLFRWDNHSSKYSRMVGMDLARKKEDHTNRQHSSKVNTWDCFSSQDFARIVCFKHNFNAKLMCDIYKHDIARKQVGLDSTIWELQKDIDVKYTWKVALNWKASHQIQKIDWPSMSPDLALIENVWELLKMKLRKKN